MKPAYAPLDERVLPWNAPNQNGRHGQQKNLTEYALPYRAATAQPYMAAIPAGRAQVPASVLLFGLQNDRDIGAMVGGAPTTYLSGPGSQYPLAPSSLEGLSMSMRESQRPDLFPLTAATYGAANALPITSMVYGPPGPCNSTVDGRLVYGSKGPDIALLVAARNKAVGPYSIESMIGLKR
ncbi:hypothetical protein HYV82_02330 [Candidatus Woesearchaeota archaeon]|nr:hypothetical protein [Candidatus Woesearchaeota archaeon]